MAVVTGQTTLNKLTAQNLITGVDATDFYVRVSAPAFIGPDTVTALNGFPIRPEDPPLLLQLGTGEDLYGIHAPGPESPSCRAYIFKNPG